MVDHRYGQLDRAWCCGSLKEFKWRSRDNGAWAIQTVERNGKYYLYAPLHGHGIGVLVADSPYGPFRDPLGKPLVWQKEHWDDIDPSVFVDDDGQAYMYWGNPHVYCIKLNEDMISTEGDILVLNPADGVMRPVKQEGAKINLRIPGSQKANWKVKNYQEGPWFYKRNGKYYLAYATTCCPEALGYAMSDSPTGPWEWKNYIMRPTERDRGNHPGICDFKGRSYIFGQDYDLMHLDTYIHHERRSVSASEINYLVDGTIPEIPYWLDEKPMQQLHWLNPYQRVEAETMAWGKGLKSAKMGILITDRDRKRADALSVFIQARAKQDPIPRLSRVVQVAHRFIALREQEAEPLVETVNASGSVRRPLRLTVVLALLRPGRSGLFRGHGLSRHGGLLFRCGGLLLRCLRPFCRRLLRRLGILRRRESPHLHTGGMAVPPGRGALHRRPMRATVTR